MAKPKTMNGTKLLIKLGDGGGPEQFAHPCLINAERGIQFSSNSTDVVVPDCDSLDAPGWNERFIDGLSAEIDGAGLLDTASIDTFWTWFSSGDSKNIQVVVDVDAADGGGYWEMAAKLSRFGVTGERGTRSQASVGIVSDGAVTWVDAT